MLCVESIQLYILYRIEKVIYNDEKNEIVLLYVSGKKTSSRWYSIFMDYVVAKANAKIVILANKELYFACWETMKKRLFIDGGTTVEIKWNNENDDL